MTSDETPQPVVGVLLAGGLSRRFGGGDKCLIELSGKSLLERVFERARPQVDDMFLNADGDASRFPDLGLEVSPDIAPGAVGPLAGVLTAMTWALLNANAVTWVATFATDTPFFPLDLIARLKNAAERDGADIAIARSGGRAHPVFALWSMALIKDLHHGVFEQRERKVMAWAERHKVVFVDFEAEPFDPFFNVNTPDDLKAAEALSGAA